MTQKKSSPLSDEELVQAALQDVENFAFLVERYETKLKYYIMRISNFSYEETEEILQEVSQERRRHGSPQDQPGQARLVVAEIPASQASQPGHKKRPNIMIEIGQNSHQCPQVHGGVENQSRLVPTQQPGNQDQVSRTADGKELGSALKCSEDDSLQGIHVISSL